MQRHAIHTVERRHAGDRFRPVLHHTSGMGDLCPRQLAGTAEISPAPSRRLHPGLRTLGNQGALKCREGPHDMKHQLAPAVVVFMASVSDWNPTP